MRPQFSIATPTHNALAALRRCVGSVRGQTGVRWEHLVNDAASTDGTPAWLATQPGLDAASAPDDGLYDAVGRCWSRARGEVLSWLNADEQYLPGALATVAAHFAANPAVDVLFGDYVVCDAAGRAIALRREIPFRRVYVANGFLYAYSCTLFFRRRLWEEGRLNFDPTLRYAADHDLLLRLAAQGTRIDHLPRYLALFGVDGGNLSTHAAAREELAVVQRRHGAAPLAALRGALSVGRRVERVLRGAYRSSGFDYAWACDEVPVYAARRACGVGGRYALPGGPRDATGPAR